MVLGKIFPSETPFPFIDFAQLHHGGDRARAVTISTDLQQRLNDLGIRAEPACTISACRTYELGAKKGRAPQHPGLSCVRAAVEEENRYFVVDRAAGMGEDVSKGTRVGNLCEIGIRAGQLQLRCLLDLFQDLLYGEGLATSRGAEHGNR